MSERSLTFNMGSFLVAQAAMPMPHKARYRSRRLMAECELSVSGYWQIIHRPVESDSEPIYNNKGVKHSD